MKLIKHDAIAKPVSVDDQQNAATVAAALASSTDFADFLNGVLSQIKRIQYGDGAGNWHGNPSGRSLVELYNRIVPAPTGNDGYAYIEVGGVAAWRPILQSYIVPPFAISSFSIAAGSVKEVGQTITQPVFSASYNRNPTTAVLTDGEGTPAKDVIATPTSFNSNASFQKTANNGSVQFTLTATRDGTTSVASATMSWRPRVFWGIGNDGGTGELFIEGLGSSSLLASRAVTFTVGPGPGQHIYFASPTAYGPATFTVGGFQGGFALVGTFSVTNAYGVAQDYYLYKSVQPNLGNTTVVVS